MLMSFAASSLKHYNFRSFYKNCILTGLASTYPEPHDKRKWIEEQMFNYNYDSAMPVTYPWPRMPEMKTRPLEPTVLHAKK